MRKLIALISTHGKSQKEVVRQAVEAFKKYDQMKQRAELTEEAGKSGELNVSKK